MEQYIKKSALVAEIERRLHFDNNWIEGDKRRQIHTNCVSSAYYKRIGSKHACECILDFINDLEVKEVDEQKERMSECPYRQVRCTMYEGHILECRGACSWVVDYPKLKEFKVQKGE